MIVRLGSEGNAADAEAEGPAAHERLTPSSADDVARERLFRDIKAMERILEEQLRLLRKGHAEKMLDCEPLLSAWLANIALYARNHSPPAGALGALERVSRKLAEARLESAAALVNLEKARSSAASCRGRLLGYAEAASSLASQPL